MILRKRNTPFFYSCLIVLMMMGLNSCDVFLEENIEDNQIVLLSPADSTLTEIVTHTFWWDKLDGASSYRLQIVTPDFSNSEALILDTLVKTNSFAITLYPGDFEWRVRGENTAYYTPWSDARLFIYASDNLTRQTVVLKSPTDNTFTNLSTVSLQWNLLAKANNYELSIYKDGWGQTLVKTVSSITVSSQTVDLAGETEVWWGVRAFNNGSETRYSSRRLVIDKTLPNTPTLVAPANNSTPTDSTVTFQWQSSDPQWTVVTDSLFIYEKRTVGGNIKYHAGKYSDKSAAVKLLKGKTYEWNVRSTDKAGNSGKVSDSFIVNIGN